MKKFMCLVWMMVALFALAAAEIPQFNLTKDYTAPARVGDQDLAAITKPGTPQNIILIIGDGMGQNVIKFASLYARGQAGMTIIDQLPVTGFALTCSADNSVTDSAASGTALSSGYKTKNAFIGMDADKKPHATIAELAKQSGRSVGILTTDALAGATPSAFSAHAENRNLAEVIADGYAKCNFDILVGSGSQKGFTERKDNRNVIDEMTGYQKIATAEEFVKADGKILGFIPWGDDVAMPGKVAAAAFQKLSANPKGFFVMFESAYPDFGGHGNNPDQSLNGVLMTESILKAAIEFAVKHPDTLIVVTADHETGGVWVAENKANPKRPLIFYTSKGHTGVPVGVYAAGMGADAFSRVIENYDIPRTFAKYWGLTLPGAK